MNENSLMSTRDVEMCTGIFCQCFLCFFFINKIFQRIEILQLLITMAYREKQKMPSQLLVLLKVKPFIRSYSSTFEYKKKENSTVILRKRVNGWILIHETPITDFHSLKSNSTKGESKVNE